MINVIKDKKNEVIKLETNRLLPYLAAFAPHP
jgi:hypothetical protein